MSVFPKLLGRKPRAQNAGGSGGLWEVTGGEGGALRKVLVPLSKSPRRAHSPLRPREDTAESPRPRGGLSPAHAGTRISDLQPPDGERRVSVVRRLGH